MYILISVCENSIETNSFSKLVDAQLQMMIEFCDAEGVDLQDCFDSEWKDEECYYDEFSAGVFDGKNHDNYSWKIINTNLL